MAFAKDIDAFYIDTVVEPWPGSTRPQSIDLQLEPCAARKPVRSAAGGRAASPPSCCGANPGMVSWFVKQALLDVAGEIGLKFDEPKTRDDWARLMHRAGVKGIHIAERDTQRARDPKPRGIFVNTWSVEGFCSEGLQPAELGWGTHEKALPPNGSKHDFGCDAAIYLTQPGAGTRVRSWTPTAQAQHAFLAYATTNWISIATPLRENGKVAHRPDLPLRLSSVRRCRVVAARDGRRRVADAVGLADPRRRRHRRRHRRARRAALRPRFKNVCWCTLSALSVEETCSRAEALPERDRPAVVTSAVLAGIVWDAGKPRARHCRG